MRDRMLRLIEQKLNDAGARAGLRSPLTTHGVGIGRV